MNTRFDEIKQLSMEAASKNPKTMLKSAVLVFWILKNKYPYDNKSINKKIYSKLFAEQNINELKKINKNAIIQNIDSAFNSWEKLDETHYINMRAGAMELNFTGYSVTVEMFGMYIDDANKLIDVLWQLGFVEYDPNSNEAYVDEDCYDKVTDGNVVIQCRSCGGELKKDGNVYICKQCGEVFKNEYAAEHGNIEVHKKVKKTSVNFSEEKTERLNNLYTIARRAKDNNDAGQAEKYYDMILAEDPNSWEAVYYTTYFNVTQCVIGQISSAASKLENCLKSVFDLIDEYAQDESAAITGVYMKTKSFADLLYSNAQSHYSRFNDTTGSSSEFFDRCIAISSLLFELANQLEKRYINQPTIGTMCAGAWKNGIEIRIKFPCDADTQNEILAYSEKIKKYDTSYQGVTFKSGGCYVATCVYGSYNCPQVWTLRRFRDNNLAKTWYGRAFIHTYYAISPTIVKWFGNTTWFKKLWRGKLDKIVRKLNNDGISNTPYEDRSWQ